jgi:hypothetical protein
MSALRDAVKLARLNVMRQRRAAMARRSAALAVIAQADAEGCTCPACQLRRGLGGGSPLRALFGALGPTDDDDAPATPPKGTH